LSLKQPELTVEYLSNARSSREPWNKGKLVGQKAPFTLKEIWAIRVRLQLAGLTLVTAYWQFAPQ
jgi:hypothetical protein